MIANDTLLSENTLSGKGMFTYYVSRERGEAAARAAKTISNTLPFSQFFYIKRHPQLEQVAALL